MEKLNDPLLDSDFLNEKILTRIGFTSFCYNNCIWIFGGMDMYIRYNDLYKYDGKHWDKVITSGSIPSSRIHSQCTIHQGFVYFFGGCSGIDGIYLNELHRFNIKTLEWTEINIENPLARIDHTFITLGNLLVLFGGMERNKLFNDIKFYQIESMHWNSPICEISPQHRFKHASTVLNNKLYIFGGSNGITLLNDMWVFDPIPLKWTQININENIPFFQKPLLFSISNKLFLTGSKSNNNPSDDLSTIFFETELQNSNQTNISEFKLDNIILNSSNQLAIHVNDSSIFFVGAIDAKTQALVITKIHINSLQNSTKTTLTMRTKSGSIINNFFENKDSQSLDSASSARVEDYLDLNSLYKWNPIESIGTLFTPRTGHTTVTVEDSFYLFGGATNNELMNDLYRFNIQQKTWYKLQYTGNAPTPRSGCKSAVIKDIIYYFGGYANRDGKYYNDLYSFNTRTNQWIQLSLIGNDINPRVNHTLNAYQNNLYLFGGSNQKKQILNDFVKIDLSDNTVKKVPFTGESPSPRFGHTADVHRNILYLFGGWDGNNTLDELYTYSFTSRIWYLERIAMGNKPPSRYRHGSSIIGSCLYIFGGINKNQFRFDDLYEFDFDQRKWTQIEAKGNTPTPRTFHQCAAYENILFVFGGNDGEKRNDCYSIVLRDNLLSKSAGIDIAKKSFCGTKALFIESDQKTLEDDTKKDKIIQILKGQVLELSMRLKVEQLRNLCIICGNRDINSVYLTCGHKCTCYNCSISFVEV